MIAMVTMVTMGNRGNHLVKMVALIVPLNIKLLVKQSEEDCVKVTGNSIANFTIKAD